MKNTEVHHRRIEQPVAKRQLFGVAFAKIDTGMELLGMRHHRCGKIHAQGRSTSTRRRGCHVTRPGGDIEKLIAPLYINRVQ